MVPTRSVSACSSRLGARLGRGLVVLSLLIAPAMASFSLGCAHTSNREPTPIVLEIATTTVDADVWVDGAYIGQVSAVSGRLRLGPGVHRVEVRKPGHFPVQRTIRVDKQTSGSVVVEAELLTDPR